MTVTKAILCWNGKRARSSTSISVTVLRSRCVVRISQKRFPSAWPECWRKRWKSLPLRSTSAKRARTQWKLCVRIKNLYLQLWRPLCTILWFHSVFWTQRCSRSKTKSRSIKPKRQRNLKVPQQTIRRSKHRKFRPFKTCLTVKTSWIRLKRIKISKSEGKSWSKRLRKSKQQRLSKVTETTQSHGSRDTWKIWSCIS